MKTAAGHQYQSGGNRFIYKKLKYIFFKARYY